MHRYPFGRCFLAAGVFWAFILCLLASHGGRLLGQNLIRYTYIASALIFAYFAVYVVVTGYAEFVGNPTAPNIEL